MLILHFISVYPSFWNVWNWDNTYIIYMANEKNKRSQMKEKAKGDLRKLEEKKGGKMWS
jgi:hypothetical protein